MTSGTKKRKIFYPGIFLLVCLVLSITLFPETSHAITKKPFDFVVGVDGNFKAALTAAGSNASSGKRFYLFFPAGEYAIGTLTGDGNQMTTITTSNISFIGEGPGSTTISNKAGNEGISITATLYFNGANNLYLQDLTVLNKGNYGDPAAANQTGRYVAIQDRGDKNIYKNVKLLSYQDTYYSLSNRTYWEECEIHGFVDFICGYGDVYFNHCLLYLENRSSVVISAPSTKTSWGYVFMNCTIDGDAGNGYRLGRPWSNQPQCVFINTTMKKLPSTEAWGDPMNVVPKLFAEYNSTNGSGAPVSLSGRRTTYTKDGTTVTINPVLSAAQAARYTIRNVLGGSDNWQPDLSTAQVSAPVAGMSGSKLVWNDNDSALCWVVFRNGKYYRCVTAPECAITASDADADFFVRAANAMGGLGTPSKSINATVTMYSLAVSVASGEGTVSPASGNYAEGAQVEVTAIPATGWMFDRWSGDLTGTANTASVTMNAAKTIYAHFIEDTRVYHTVTVTSTPGGAVIQEPPEQNLPEGSSITFTGVPVKGWKFNGWAGDYTGTDSVFTIASLDADITLSAQFVPVDLFTYEAEYGTIDGADTENKNSGFSGEGYVNFTTATGSSVTMLVYTALAGERQLQISFTNGSGTSRTLSVAVNDNLQHASVDFAATPDWTSWQIKVITVTLQAGANTITLATTSDQDGPNVDKIAFDPTFVARYNRGAASLPVTLSYYPAIRRLNVKLPEPGSGNLRIYSPNGTLVFSKRISAVFSANGVVLQLPELAEGLYFAVIDGNGAFGRQGYPLLVQ